MPVDGMGPPLRSCAEMSKQRQKQTALLLIAILTMLPLHGIQAALSALAHQPGDVHPPAQHVEHAMQDAAGMHACKMHQQNMADATSGHQCDGSGCDMCGACAADLPSLPSLLLSHERLLPEPADEIRLLRTQSYSLYRPPRA